jgi:hypothetical protein
MEIEKILQYLLPQEIHDFFDLVNLEEDNTGRLLLYLDEKAIKPTEHSDKELISKGFDEPVQIQDFPIRGRAVYVVVRRRKWMDKSTGKIYSTNWNLTAKGTGYTSEFAAFLKELFGSFSDKQQ